MNEHQLSRRSFVALSTATVAAAQSPAPVGERGTAKTVNIGVVGGGFGSQFQWALHPHSKVAAVCDIRPDRLDHLATVFRCESRYKTFREMLKHPGLDAVAVFTPVPLHAWMAVESLKAGKHVISAVPAAFTEEQLAGILETVKRTGLRYMMAETSRFRPEVMTCVEWSEQGKFGTIFYGEAEYHHEGLIALAYDDRGMPTWRYGLPPMHYPTHATGLVIPVMRERLTEVTAVGWGDGHEILQSNAYKNPFWNTTGFFKTSGGHCCRIQLCRHIAADGTERGHFYGDRMSFIMARPEGSPNTVFRIGKDGQTVLDENGYPQGKVTKEKYDQLNHFEKLPPPLRVQTGHGGSHSFITHEFISAIREDRHPIVNIWEAIAYTLPGIVAHQSALKGGEPMKIRDYGLPST